MRSSCGIIFVLVTFAIFAAIISSCLSCSIDLDGDVVVFGTAFDDQAGRTVLLWPADPAGDAFRCVVSDDYSALHRTEAGLVSRNEAWKLEEESAHRFLVILPIEASPELRGRGSELVDAMERRYPDAGLHRVFSSEDWLAAHSGRDASLLLRRMGERSRDEQWKYQGLFAGLFDDSFSMLLMPTVTALVTEDEQRPFEVFAMVATFEAPKLNHLSQPERVDETEFDALVRERIATAKQGGFPLKLQFLLLLPADVSERAMARAVSALERLAEYDRVTASLHRSEQTLAELRALTSR